MFKKLKEKITEEVKSSPQRLQQLTQSVSDRLQNASTSDENFFSIGDDDANVSNTSLEPGFTNVSLMSPQETKFRRNSNSSIASDVSFLPKYESFANMYHLQSDLEVSASEIEDNASTSSQLGHLSKEQIYSAFQKAQMRYHKYRGRYTDLAKHYKDLERENSKMKSVLVDTQDKAIRRVAELKEQCGLEQKAKAHLESALRDEMDEKQFKIESLQTKIELLQNGGSSNEDMDNLNKYLTEARQEIENLNEKIQEMKANAIIFQTKEQEYKKEIAAFTEREKENNLSLAQTKMELHNELLSKDTEINNLRKDNEVLRKNLEVNNKLDNLQNQNKNLIEKLENLTQKCNVQESDLLKMQQYKIEMENAHQANADLKNQLEKVREDAKKSLLSLEHKIEEKLYVEFERKEEEMKNDFARKIDEITSSEDTLKDVQIKLMEKEEDNAKLKQINEGLLDELTAKNTKYDDLERNHLELIEECVEMRNKVSSLEKEAAQLKAQNMEQQKEADKNEVLELHLRDLEEEKKKLTKAIEEEKENCSQYHTENINLNKEIAVLKASVLTLEDSEDTLKNIQSKLKEKEEENVNLKQVNEGLVHELTTKNNKYDDLERDHLQLIEDSVQMRNKVTNLESEMTKLTAQILEQENKAIKFEAIKNEELESRLTNLEEEKKKLIAAVEEDKETSYQYYTENIDLHTKIDILKRSLENRDGENQNLQKKVQDLEKELVQFKVGNGEIQLMLKKAETERDQLLQRLSEKVNEANIIQNTKEDLLSKTEDFKIKVEELQLLVGSKEAELADVESLVKSKDEEISVLEGKLVQMVSTEESLKRLSEERDHNMEEINLLKKLLEEANNNLTIKEHEFTKLEENLKKTQQEFLQKISTYEEDLNLKNLQTESLSKRIEDYHDLIEERNEGLLKIFANFPRASPNNVRHLQNIEEKLQNFEKTFSVEKENLTKVLAFLKQLEEKSSSAESEKNQLLEKLQKQIHDIKLLEDEIVRLKEENSKLFQEQTTITKNIQELESRNTQIVSDSNFLSDENTTLVTEIEELKLKNEEMEFSKFEEISKNQNLERQIKETQQEKQLLLEEIQELKSAPLNLDNNNMKTKEEDYVREIDNLKTKIVQYKSLDLTNRSSIEFYENELQKLKNQNEKLNRKLDETLVTLNHCSELSNSTEIEYLRNVLYNYMLGKESLVLARVIAAVCKFDPHQTEIILAKEHQKQTLLGQLGIL